MCSKLVLAKYVLEESFVLKTAVFRKLCKLAMTEFTVKDVTLFRVATFLSEALCQIKFLRNLRNIQYNFKDC